MIRNNGNDNNLSVRVLIGMPPGIKGYVAARTEEDAAAARNGVRQKPKDAVAGWMFGAVTALTEVLGYDAEESEKEMAENVPTIYRKQIQGVFSRKQKSELIGNWVTEILRRSTEKGDMTFRELQEYLEANNMPSEKLVVLARQIRDGQKEPFGFSVDTTPDLSIREAIKASFGDKSAIEYKHREDTERGPAEIADGSYKFKSATFGSAAKLFENGEYDIETDAVDFGIGPISLHPRSKGMRTLLNKSQKLGIARASFWEVLTTLTPRGVERMYREGIQNGIIDLKKYPKENRIGDNNNNDYVPVNNFLDELHANVPGIDPQTPNLGNADREPVQGDDVIK